MNVVTFKPLVWTLTACFLAVFGFAATSAIAEPSSESIATSQIQKNLYGGVGFGTGWKNPNTGGSAFDVNDRYGNGAQLSMGIDLNRYVSLEMHATRLGAAGLSPDGEIRYNTFGGSTLLYMGKNRSNFKRRGLSAYARWGFGFLQHSKKGDAPIVKENAYHILIGAGVEYMFDRGFGLRLEGLSFEADARYAQLGFVYRFGESRIQKPVETVQIPESAPVIPPVTAVVVAEPEPVAPNPCDEFEGTLEGVNFHSDSSTLTDSAMAVLTDVAATLALCEEAPVFISAHTDSVGSAKYNFALSDRRAHTVATHLLTLGVSGDRIKTEAFGETQPIATNDTPEGRRKNRRVELIAK